MNFKESLSLFGLISALLISVGILTIGIILILKQEAEKAMILLSSLITLWAPSPFSLKKVVNRNGLSLENSIK